LCRCSAKAAVGWKSSDGDLIKGRALLGRTALGLAGRTAA
jgi:hypothetical protein